MGLFDGWMGWASVALAVAAPVVSHVVGWLTLRRIRRVRANVADTIAGLSARIWGDGTSSDAARRFDRAVDDTTQARPPCDHYPTFIAESPGTASTGGG